MNSMICAESESRNLDILEFPPGRLVLIFETDVDGDEPAYTPLPFWMAS